MGSLVILLTQQFEVIMAGEGVLYLTYTKNIPRDVCAALTVQNIENLCEGSARFLDKVRRVYRSIYWLSTKRELFKAKLSGIFLQARDHKVGVCLAPCSPHEKKIKFR